MSEGVVVSKLYVDTSFAIISQLYFVPGKFTGTSGTFVLNPGNCTMLGPISTYNGLPVTNMTIAGGIFNDPANCGCVFENGIAED